MPPPATLKPARRQPIRASAYGIESAIEHGLRAIARLESRGLALGFSELGDIELPPDDLDQASLEAAAALYLASDLEEAGLIPAVELVAGLFASGTLSLATGPAADKLSIFWRGRRERFSPEERSAFFVRLFGAELGAGLAGEDGSNRAFVPLMIGLAKAFIEYQGHPLWASKPGPREETRVRTAARQLAANLVPRSGGMAPFAAREILTTAKAAIEVFKEAAVQSLFGSLSVWATVGNVFKRYGGEVPEITTHLTRGKSGQTILAWLAGASVNLDDYSVPVVAHGYEVLAAAVAWAQASLALEKRSTVAAEALGGQGSSAEDEIPIYEATLMHADQPEFPRLPAPGSGEDSHTFTIPVGKRFSRWEIRTIEAGLAAGCEITQAPERGAVGEQALKVSWWHPPFGKVHVQIRAYASTTGNPSPVKVVYDSTGWLEQCRDHLRQGVPLGIAVEGAAADQLHAALEKTAREHPEQLSARPFVAGVDDAIILAVIGAIVLVVIAGMGFFVLYNIIQSAMEKGYEIRDTSFKVGGGEGPTRVDSEIVFNLIPPGMG